MTIDEKLAAILAAVQTDPGNRGLAHDPDDNLFNAFPGDFAATCRSLADHPEPAVDIFTGFFIPTSTPPAAETDGPLGAVFLARALIPLGVHVGISAERWCEKALTSGLTASGFTEMDITAWDPAPDPGGRRDRMVHVVPKVPGPKRRRSHYLALERPGPAEDGRCHTMRGRDITDLTAPVEVVFAQSQFNRVRTIGVGDGGNEIGMGKVSHETIVKNVPNGAAIHCRVPTDFLIVSGVSNWGAYALAAGVYMVRGADLPADLFDPDRERAILEVMVRDGPLVDGVVGKPSVTVDGLSWDDYTRPLRRMREIFR
ncbi:DUF4392 domain-containing protein [Fimbriiglobus ruber]|uniref:D-glutamate cyclase-like C-terminal domain-containing protein n=1 Tax=Fimbriiglobus ruber TaxID=1908690 RepID=A0A225DYU7_9BACT|nr:glutamate cyclase domain-containing protein [Fimbriiglobus ruber]OWK46700.1 hypothetical protein FRUB_00399 [Fimbriiglobus ruber]